MITISYDFNYTPVITGMMLLTVSFLVAWDWNTLKVIVGKQPDQAQPDSIEYNNVWMYTGLLIFLFTAAYRLLYDRYDLILWLTVCVILGFAGFLYWLKRRDFELVSE